MPEEVQRKMTFEELLSASSIQLSDEQLAAVLSDTATVVSAGAGSGKTTVLSLRFVRLVLDGKAHADEILTLTFTRKAAAEMYERIYRLLSIAAESSDETAAELREHFPKARISTMDSFWSEIARTDSLRFGIARDFQFLEGDEAAADDLVRNVYEELQGRSGLERGFMVLSEIYRSDEILSILGDIASEHTDILTSFDAAGNTSSYLAFISLLRDRYCGERADYIFSSLSDLDAENPANGQHAEIQQALEAYRSEDWMSLPSFNLNKLRKAADRKIQSFIKEEDCKGYFAVLRSIAAIEKTADDAAAVSDVIASFISALQSRKRQLGLLSYRDVEALCRAVLLTNHDVRSYYKESFRYIMVDEFQDNNGSQRDLLYLLSERPDIHGDSIPEAGDIDPDKLFFVGDDKQSIYYFRGADVSVFRSLKEDILRIGGKNLSLSANYRSEPALIDHFNNVFSEVFSTGLSEEDMEKEELMSAFTGVSFSSFHASAETIRARSPYPGVVPRIEMAAIPADECGEDMASPDDAEAVFIARRILEMMEDDGYMIPDGKGGLRHPRFGDIAVLLRTTAPQMPVERAFRMYGIPYVVQESTSATIEGIGWDIYAFLQLIVYPEDRLAYMAVLRSPFARISDEGLLFLRADNAAAFSSDPSFRSESDRKAYENVKALYFELRGMAGRRRIASIISRLFHESGYSTYLQSSPYLSVYAEHFEYLWAAASLYDSASRPLPEFLDYLRPLIGQAKKLQNASVQHLETDGVQIMTIHRSKGLQFPIVFLSDADHGPGNLAGRSRLIALEGSKPCIMPDLTDDEGPNIILQEMAGYRKRREEAELRRLLYVALTRAVDHIVVTAHLRKRRTGLSLLDIYREGCSIAAETIPPVPASSLFPEEKAERNLEWYLQPVAPEPGFSERRFGVKDASHREREWTQGGGEELPPLPSDSIVMAHSIQQEFGTMVHAALEAAVSGKEAVYSFPPSLSGSERGALLEALSEITASFLSSEFFRTFIDGHRSETEVRFYYPADGGVAEGAADLLIFGNEYNLVVDYKTDRYMDESVHMGQIMAYAEAMESLYEKKCLAVLLYVRGWRQGTFVNSEGKPVRGLSRL